AVTSISKSNASIRLDVYIYDYLMKRNLHASAKTFQAEGKVSSDPVGRLFSISGKFCMVLLVVLWAHCSKCRVGITNFLQHNRNKSRRKQFDFKRMASNSKF
ncbi:hypothetical protein GW17_00012856, partial [Ensete ventricosum]